MRLIRPLFVLLAIAVLLPTVTAAADPVYREPNEYPILDEIIARRDAIAARIDSLTQIVRDDQQARAEMLEDQEMDLRVDWTGIQIPDDPESFRVFLPHMPPTPQFYTGTCWSFCSTSFLESEVARLTGHKIKLSEMWTVYWAYVEKVRRFVRERGDSVVEQGGQSGDTIFVFETYGAVPKSAYTGVLFEDARHDHKVMLQELHAWLELIEERNIWDEERAVAVARLILDAHMGPPPETFEHDGREWDPITFRDDMLKLEMDEYVSVVSRMDQPFESWVLLDVVDNWRRSERYFNLPIDDFSEIIKLSVRKGYTVDIGGDNSEPGLDGKMDAAIIPEWDIPARYISQGARELRIVNETTTDDHGMHIVGYTQFGDREWYLIKDSNRSSRLGKHEGYYFFDANYVKLKMLAFMVHEDMLEGYLAD